jgi:hypothetical protein
MSSKVSSRDILNGALNQRTCSPGVPRVSLRRCPLRCPQTPHRGHPPYFTYFSKTYKPEFIVLFGGRKSEDFAENPLPRISMFTSSRVWSDFGRISQQIRGFQIDYECGLITVTRLIVSRIILQKTLNMPSP